MSATSRPKPLVLCILDGFGERTERDANAVRLARSPNLDKIRAEFPHTLIGTSGPDVGLPVGQMGNSEVGHLSFGAGRIALTDISRIDVAIAEKQLSRNEVLSDLVERAKDRKSRFHLMGLVSDGGVHSSLEHLLALIDFLAYHELQIVVHAFLDGRDTPPKSAEKYLRKLDYALDGKGVIGTVAGRYWAMDRDKRWDRVMKAWRAIVREEGAGDPKAEAIVPRFENVFDALRANYAEGKTDEFVEPARLGDYDGVKGDYCAEFGGGPLEWQWHGEEVGFAFNFRPDRMRELCAMLTRRNLPNDVAEMLVQRQKPMLAFEGGCFAGMTEYDKALELPIAFKKEDVKRSFGEVISDAGLSQLRCAETEKYAHVTYFFSGGREETFNGEERKLVPSPRDVATYDLKPEMSADAVSTEVVTAIQNGKYDFILVNLANPDMVGHTGNLEAAIKAVEAVDRGIGDIWQAVREKNGALIITADHGNCETMVDENGQPHTAHTTNPVPLYLVDETRKNVELRSGGRIADVAPTMLEMLGVAAPAEMTGKSLLVK
ncbi:MAG: 2,3-bisphosphoglycerate-independent phosphoglycerate mutase [Polyangiaceae bacterium]|nr:2,3-bisphosphoglycerate-independent phosphoglycerate mutase [Polyangiaceae bacterium]